MCCGTEADKDAQFTQTYVTVDLTAGQWLLCYATSASGGNKADDYVGQMFVTVAAPTVTYTSIQNANVWQVVAGMDLPAATDAPNGDYLALIPPGNTLCTGNIVCRQPTSHRLYFALTSSPGIKRLLVCLQGRLLRYGRLVAARSTQALALQLVFIRYAVRWHGCCGACVDIAPSHRDRYATPLLPPPAMLRPTICTRASTSPSWRQL